MPRFALDRLDEERGGARRDRAFAARRRRRTGRSTVPAGTARSRRDTAARSTIRSIVIVRPWKLPWHAMISARPSGMPLTLWPHLRAALSAVSTASAPPLAGSTRSSPVSCASRSSSERQLVVVIGARRDAELLRLRDQRADDPRMRVAEADRGIRAHQVEVAAAVDVGQPAAFAARQHDRQRLVVARAKRLLAADQVGSGIGNRGGRMRGPHECWLPSHAPRKAPATATKAGQTKSYVDDEKAPVLLARRAERSNGPTCQVGRKLSVHDRFQAAHNGWTSATADQTPANCRIVRVRSLRTVIAAAQTYWNPPA